MFGAADGVLAGPVCEGRLSAGAALRLKNGDRASLYRAAVEATEEAGGDLLDFDLVEAAGRPAIRRVERLPHGVPPGYRYGGALIILLAGVNTAEIPVLCPQCAGIWQADEPCDPDLTRIRETLSVITANVRLPDSWLSDITDARWEPPPDFVDAPG